MIAPLSSGRWKELEPLIDAAVDLPRARWPAFLDDACSGDAALRAEAERLLLEYDRADTLLDHPAAQRFGSLLGAVAAPPPELVNGNYRIERKLGQGGMATVYLAHDLRHDRKVAVKVLHPELAAAFRAEQFLAEIRTMAQLRHPHILPLYDSGESDGLLFYVMPYVEGETLRQRIERETQLGVEDAARITREVASALDSAHSHGVIHRDIKPENILLDDAGAQVADFGIALAVSAASSLDASQSGWIAGTPRYMSPEQMSGEDAIDGRSDVFSLGAVAYEMLAGQPPFSGPTITAIRARRVALPPPPPLRALRGGIPTTADAVVAKSLAHQPGDRYRTAGELADALQRSLVGRGTRRSRLAAAIGIVVLAGVLGAIQVRLKSGASMAAAVPTSAGPHGPHQTRNLAAYDLYQRGRDQAWSRSDSGARLAIQYFKQAIAADSTYAAAYAELAHMYGVAVLGNGTADLSRREAVADAQAAALKAVSLDDSLADAHAELGFVRMFVTYDMASATAELNRAVALDPASGRVHTYLANLYEWTERPVEALAEARRASEIDPLSVEASIGLAVALYDDGRYDEALVQLAKLRAVRPPVRRVSEITADIDVMKGMFSEAIDSFGGKKAGPSGYLGHALAVAGRRAEARRILAEIVASARRDGEGAYDVAIVYEGLGDYDQAIAWLEKSFEDHTLWIIIMTPMFDHLRADPRFDRIRRRLNGRRL